MRIYLLRQGADRQFEHEIKIKNYPNSWVARKARAPIDKVQHPRNTLVRMAYAAVLVDQHRLSEAERELWLASIDSNAIAAVLPGNSKNQLFVELTEVLLMEGKKGEARSALAKACGHAVSIDNFDMRAPCGEE